MLHNDASPGAQYCRIRTLFRLQHFDRAVEAAETADRSVLTEEEIVCLDATHVFVLARMGRLAEASAVLSSAIAFGQMLKDDLAALLLNYAAAYVDYCSSRLQQCEQGLLHIMERTDSVRRDTRRYAFQLDLFSLRAHAATFLGCMYLADDRPTESERFHIEAFLSSERSYPRDSYHDAVILANLSCVVAYCYSPAGMLLLNNRSTTLRWNAGLDEQRGYIKRNLRTAGYIFGRGARSEDIGGRSAPSLALRLLDCAEALIYNEWPSAEAFASELSFARDLLFSVGWDGTIGEEFESLSNMVAVLASSDVKTAGIAYRLYVDKLASIPSHYPHKRAKQEQAQMRFITGCLAKAQGRLDAALVDFEIAHKMWLSTPPNTRASLAAIESFPISRNREQLNTVNDFVGRYPGSPYSNRLKRALAYAEDTRRSEFLYLNPANAVRVRT